MGGQVLLVQETGKVSLLVGNGEVKGGISGSGYLLYYGYGTFNMTGTGTFQVRKRYGLYVFLHLKGTFMVQGLPVNGGYINKLTVLLMTCGSIWEAHCLPNLATIAARVGYG